MTNLNNITNGEGLTRILSENRIPSICAGSKIKLVPETDVFSASDVGASVFLDGFHVGALDMTHSGKAGFYRVNRPDIVERVQGKSFPLDYEIKFPGE